MASAAGYSSNKAKHQPFPSSITLALLIVAGDKAISTASRSL
jgi:hypothetical protein